MKYDHAPSEHKNPKVYIIILYYVKSALGRVCNTHSSSDVFLDLTSQLHAVVVGHEYN